MWIAGGIVSFIAILVGMLKFVSHQRDTARDERDVAVRNQKTLEKVNKAQEDLAAITASNRKETADAKAVKITERPTGSFGSKRLRK